MTDHTFDFLAVVELERLKSNIKNVDCLRGVIIGYMVTLEVHLDFFISSIFFGGIDSDKSKMFRKYVLQAQFGLARKIDLIKDLIMENNPKNKKVTEEWLTNLSEIKKYRDRMAHGEVNNFDLMQDANLDLIISTIKKGQKNSVTLSKGNLKDIIKRYFLCIEFYSLAKDDIESYFKVIRG